jgi:hypothetical protein
MPSAATPSMIAETATNRARVDDENAARASILPILHSRARLGRFWIGVISPGLRLIGEDVSIPGPKNLSLGIPA